MNFSDIRLDNLIQQHYNLNDDIHIMNGYLDENDSISANMNYGDLCGYFFSLNNDFSTSEEMGLSLHYDSL